MYFRTKAERYAWVMEANTNAVSYAVKYNPRGAYDVIQSWWPGELQFMAPGAESTEVNENMMHDFVMAKVQLAGSMGGQLATDFMHAVPPSDQFDSSLTFLIQ